MRRAAATACWRTSAVSAAKDEVGNMKSQQGSPGIADIGQGSLYDKGGKGNGKGKRKEIKKENEREGKRKKETERERKRQKERKEKK